MALTEINNEEFRTHFDQAQQLPEKTTELFLKISKSECKRFLGQDQFEDSETQQQLDLAIYLRAYSKCVLLIESDKNNGSSDIMNQNIRDRRAALIRESDSLLGKIKELIDG